MPLKEILEALVDFFVFGSASSSQAITEKPSGRYRTIRIVLAIIAVAGLVAIIIIAFAMAISS